MAHNALNAHAKAVHLYRSRFQPVQKGVIGITLNLEWALPYTNTRQDIDAAERFAEFELGWFADPVHFGRYPQSMVDRLGPRLPRFTAAESDLLKGSSDFFGINHYSTWYVQHRETDVIRTRDDDLGLRMTEFDPQGKLVGPYAASVSIYHITSSY